MSQDEHDDYLVQAKLSKVITTVEYNIRWRLFQQYVEGLSVRLNEDEDTLLTTQEIMAKPEVLEKFIDYCKDAVERVEYEIEETFTDNLSDDASVLFSKEIKKANDERRASTQMIEAMVESRVQERIKDYKASTKNGIKVQKDRMDRAMKILEAAGIFE